MSLYKYIVLQDSGFYATYSSLPMDFHMAIGFYSTAKNFRQQRENENSQISHTKVSLVRVPDLFSSHKLLASSIEIVRSYRPQVSVEGVLL
jgi:hypothetical protein